MIFQEALRASLQAHSDSTAIESASQNFTYRALAEQADAITAALLARKPAAQSPVGIELRDPASLIISLIGIANARLVFVPIDPKLPAARKELIRKETGLSLIIGEEAQKSKGLEVLAFDTLVAQPAGAIDYPACGEQDSLYIYFTSGSTGKPKGIIGKNASLIQFINWEVAEFEIDNSFRVSQLISPYFDAFLRDVFVPIMAGGTLCIPPQEEDLFSPEKLSAWINDARINLIHCVPSVFRIFGTGAIDSSYYYPLRYILMSGEKIPPSSLKVWYDTFGDQVQLVNLYGTTETTMIRSAYRIKPEDVKKPKISIGQPIADTKLLVAKDDSLKPSSMFMTGDLYIISPYLSKGYLNNKKLNAEKFIKVSDDPTDYTYAFNTGDKARMVVGGEIELIGREDRQIKLRGIRIELDEIETALLAHAGVSQAAVMVREEEGGESILAFVIAEGSKGEEILAWLKEQLPVYMLPSDVRVVSKFPLLSNGKISYKELLAMSETRTLVAPASPTEEKLLGIWKDLLGDKDISTTDNFHQIGGNSLSLMRLTARIYKDFNIRMTLNQLFKNLNIQKQGAFIDQAARDNAYQIKKAAPAAQYPLSSAQERIYYFSQLDKESTAFNMPIAWELKAGMDIDKIKEALRTLVIRHESLRTSFVFDKDQIYQKVHDLPALNFRQLSADEEDLDEVMTSLIQPFDLRQSSLMRVFFIDTDKGRTLMLIDMHHIICDGASQINLLNDFRNLYQGEQLAELPVQYKDYASWEYSFKMTVDYLKHREFWLTAFEGGDIPVLQLPSSGDDSSDKGANSSFSIPRAAIEPIVEALGAGEVTTFSLLYTLYLLYLSQLSGQQDIIIGINTTGRLQAEVENLVGMFAKTLPIRQQLDAEQTFPALVSQVHDYLVQANSKQIYDLVDIVYELNKERDSPVGELFQTMFVFQNFENASEDFQEQNLREYEVTDITAKYPITLYAAEDKEAFRFRFEYRSSYFTAGDMEVLIDQFKQLLSRVAARPAAQIADLGIVQESTSEPLAGDMSFDF